MVVVDTNVASYIFNGTQIAHYYLQQIHGLRAFISFQTLEEIWYGAYVNGWGAKRRNELALHLEQYEIIWPNAELVEICARLRCAVRAAGRRLEMADAWIAATALLLQCPLVSHDRDFSKVPNLQVIKAP